MEEKKSLTGTTIKLDKKHHDMIDDLTNNTYNALTAYNQAVISIRKTEGELWSFLGEIHPETTNYHTSFNHVKKEIKIFIKKKDGETNYAELKRLLNKMDL